MMLLMPGNAHYRLMRRNTEYAEIRDVRGASVLLSQSIIQFLVPGMLKEKQENSLSFLSDDAFCYLLLCFDINRKRCQD